MVRDAVGDPTAVAGPGEVPQGRPVTIQALERRAGEQTDTVAAAEMQQAKDKLFASIHGRKTA